jgi:hypothetical protein
MGFVGAGQSGVAVSRGVAGAWETWAAWVGGADGAALQPPSAARRPTTAKIRVRCSGIAISLPTPLCTDVLGHDTTWRRPIRAVRVVRGLTVFAAL